MDMKNYLTVVADSDLFGTLAFISLVVALIGLYRPVREHKAYKIVVFICLLFMPILHVIGSYYLSQPAA